MPSILVSKEYQKKSEYAFQVEFLSTIKRKSDMKTIMFYDIALDGLSKAKDNINAHRERLLEFHEKGVLLMAGPLANPTDGAIGIFTNMDAAKDFVEGDPFVKNGVVGKYRLVEWNEVLTE